MRWGVGGAKYGEVRVGYHRYLDLHNHEFPLRNTQICSKMALMPQNFLRLRRAERGFAFGSELHSPKSATLTVAIIPVTPQEGVAAPGSAQRSGGDVAAIQAEEDIRSPGHSSSGVE